MSAPESLSQTSPHRLVQMLMEGVVQKLQQAKIYMEQDDAVNKAEEIAKVINIIEELKACLDKEKGSEIATNLFDLYTYMNQQLILANDDNDTAKMEEVIQLMTEIKTAWDGISEQ